jgi:hypothetical protein
MGPIVLRRGVELENLRGHPWGRFLEDDQSAAARILQKLDVRDRVQAVIYAYETGLIAPGWSH